jgi:hypothetical protein
MDEKRKRLRFSIQFILLIVAFIALGLGVLKPWQPSPPTPTPHNYSLVKPGMYLTQVERLLGPMQHAQMHQQRLRKCVWVGTPCLVVEVLFGLDGKVESASVLSDQDSSATTVAAPATQP